MECKEPLRMTLFRFFIVPAQMWLWFFGLIFGIGVSDVITTKKQLKDYVDDGGDI